MPCVKIWTNNDILRRITREIVDKTLQICYNFVSEIIFRCCMIVVENLNKTFKTAAGSITALDDISFTINDGEIFGVIGLSGAGKSTLVRCLNLLERPSAGKVIIDGMDLMSLSRKDLLKMRRNIGMIFQSFNLFEQRNAISNVTYPLEIAGISRTEAKEKAMALLEMVGLSDRVKSYPSQLSGGQKQRVAIARALATDPKYLLCDEATSALDPNTTQQILSLLKDINKKLGVTIVVITHEMRVIDQICDRVAVIDKSKIAEIGEVSDIFANPQSEIARELILPSSPLASKSLDNRCLRIIFDGESSYRPVLAEMILSCQTPVNIMFANTKDIDGRAFGQIIVQVPKDKHQADKLTAWLRINGMKYSEEVLENRDIS